MGGPKNKFETRQCAPAAQKRKGGLFISSGCLGAGTLGTSIGIRPYVGSRGGPRVGVVGGASAPVPPPFNSDVPSSSSDPIGFPGRVRDANQGANRMIERLVSVLSNKRGADSGMSVEGRGEAKGWIQGGRAGKGQGEG